MVDTNCPYVEYLFDDALRITTGEHKCMAQAIERDANLNPLDYHPCSSDYYKTCAHYLRKGDEKVVEV
jgi:hypothetical protein